jgi:eukaryotic-like serine/threonine-protein kinase
VQDEIAEAIAEVLRVKLGAVQRRYAPTLAAYEAFLKGRHHWAKLTPESLARSREYFEQAVALDPQFALARNNLAEHFFALTASGLMPPDEAIPRVRAEALAALQIDPGLVESHALLGLMAATLEYDWNEAARRFQLARRREHVVPYVRWFYGQYLQAIGQAGKAVEELERALQDDPLHLLCRCHLANNLHAMGRRAEAFKHVLQVLEIDDTFYIGHWYLSLFEALERRVPEALASAERTHALTPWNTIVVGLLAGVAARAGDSARAETLLTQLRPTETFGFPIGWVVYHLVCMETEKAAEWLDKVIQQHDQRVVYVLPYMRTTTRWPRIAKNDESARPALGCSSVQHSPTSEPHRDVKPLLRKTDSQFPRSPLLGSCGRGACSCR